MLHGRGLQFSFRSTLRSTIAWYSTVTNTELPELQNATKLFKEGNISGALAEMDRADQICKNVSPEDPILLKILKQRYWILQQTVSKDLRNEIPSLLERIVNAKLVTPSTLSWKQMHHENLLLSSQISKSNNIMQDIKAEKTCTTTNENLLRYQICLSRKVRLSKETANEEILNENFLADCSPLLRAEGQVEKGDSLIDTKPRDALACYVAAIKSYSETQNDVKNDEEDPKGDLIRQALEIRRARSFLLTNKDDRFALDDDDFMKEFSDVLHNARVTQSKYWGELVGIMGMILHCKSNFTFGEGMYRKAIEIFEDDSIAHMQKDWEHVVIAEIKQSYKLLASVMMQTTVASNLDTETELLELRYSKSLSSSLPHSILPFPIEEEIQN